MRTRGYATIVVSVIAVAAIGAWVLRNTLIQRISNPLLQEYDIALTDVSLDALGAGDATISYLKLVHKKGTTIEVEDLSLPIGTANDGAKLYAARKVRILTDKRDDGEPFDLAQLIDQLLSLHGNMGNSTVIIEKLSLPPYPDVEDLQLTITEQRQDYRATIDSVAIAISASTADSLSTPVTFSLPIASTSEPIPMIAANLQRRDTGYNVHGESAINLPAWEALAKLAGIFPTEVKVGSGIVTLQFDAQIPLDATHSPSTTAHISLSSPLHLTYTTASGDSANLVVVMTDAITVDATFPKVTWKLQLEKADVLASYDGWEKIPLSLDKLECEAGVTCAFRTSVIMEDADLPFGSVRHIEFSSTHRLFLDESGLRLELSPDARLDLNGITTADFQIGRATTRLTSEALLTVADIGWSLSAAALDTEFEKANLADGVSVTAAAYLSDLALEERNRELALETGVYIPSTETLLSGQTLSTPGAKGRLTREGADLSFDAEIVGLYKNGAIKVEHNLDSNGGKLQLSDNAVSFGASKASDRVNPWRNEWDLVAGIVSADVEARWAMSNGNISVSATTSVQVDDLAGNYRDTAFVGLSTRSETVFDSESGFASKPSAVSVALIDVGVPLEGISADYTLDVNIPGADVQALRLSAFGGTISADPFSFSTDDARNNVVVHGNSIELDELLTLKEFEAIEVSGRIGAKLPVTIEGDTIIVVDGVLFGEAPGGVIRYLPGGDADSNDGSSLGFAKRALSNFEYESLTADVEYSIDGDLNLQLRLTGRNPDLDEKRPVVLNLGIENNVPDMLRSLRAARAVEDVLEKRLQQ